MRPHLKLTRVSKYYGDFHTLALRDIRLSIEPGSTVALLGRNGAGKTTLLRIIAGLSKASEGSVRIQNADVRQQATRRRIGVLGHGISLYDELSATENLVLFRQSLWTPGAGKDRPDLSGSNERDFRLGPRRLGSRIFPRNAAASGSRARFHAHA